MHAPTAVSVTISESKGELTLNAFLSVVSLVPGGAAERAGVRVGDTLLAVGGAAQQQGDAGMQAALAAIKSAPRPVSLLFARGGGGGSDGGALPPQLAQRALRLFASFALGIAIFTLVSGGFAIISSALVIAQAACLLNLTRSAEALALASAKLFGGADCADCNECCSSIKSLRALSIAGMVFAIITILAIFPSVEAIGVLLSYNGYQGGGFNCYSPVYSYCYPYYNIDTGIYLLYAASHTLVSAVLHLALSVTMFRLVRLFKPQQLLMHAEGGDRQPLVGASLADAYVTMGDGKAALPTPPAMPSRAYGNSTSYVAPGAGFSES